MSALTFADLEGQRATDRRACRGCGAKPLAGVVRLEARAYGATDPAQPLKGGRTLASTSLSLCEACVVRVYRAAELGLAGDIGRLTEERNSAEKVRDEALQAIEEMRARISWVRGMCTDEEPHTLIDAKLAEVLAIVEEPNNGA